MSAAQAEEPRTFVNEHGPRRVIVGEHPSRVFLSIGDDFGGQSAMLEPALAIAIAGQLLNAAAKALDAQFQQRMGGP